MKKTIQPKPTFFHRNGRSSSNIDYILIPVEKEIGNYHAFDKSSLNTSTHVPVTMRLNHPIPICEVPKGDPTDPGTTSLIKRIKLEKCNKSVYSEMLDYILDSLFPDDIGDDCDVDKYVSLKQQTTYGKPVENLICQTHSRLIQELSLEV